MNKITFGTPSTFSGVVLTAVLVGTLSLTLQTQPNQNLFSERLISRPGYTSGVEGTYENYPNRRSEQTTAADELKKLVDKVLNSQVAPDVEFDIIIANNIRSLYQHGFTE